MNRKIFAAFLILPLCAWGADTALIAASQPAARVYKVETTTLQGDKALRLPMSFTDPDWKKAWKNAGMDAKYNAGPSEEIAWLYVTWSVYQLQDVDGKTLISGPRGDLELDKANCLKMHLPKASVCGFLAVPGAAGPEWWHEHESATRPELRELMWEVTKNFVAAYNQVASSEAAPTTGNPSEASAAAASAPAPTAPAPALPVAAVQVPPTHLEAVPTPVAAHAAAPVAAVAKATPALTPASAVVPAAAPATVAATPVAAAPVAPRSDAAESVKSLARSAAPLQLAMGAAREPGLALAEPPKPELHIFLPKFSIRRVVPVAHVEVAAAAPVAVAPVAVKPVAVAAAVPVPAAVAPAVPKPAVVEIAKTTPAPIGPSSASAESLKSLARSAAPPALVTGPRVEPGYALAEPPKPELHILTPRFSIHRIVPVASPAPVAAVEVPAAAPAAPAVAAVPTSAPVTPPAAVAAAVTTVPLTTLPVAPHSAMLEVAERKAAADHLEEAQLARARSLSLLPAESVAEVIPINVSVQVYRPRMATSTVFAEKVRTAGEITTGHTAAALQGGFDADTSDTAFSGGRMLRPAAKSASLPTVVAPQ